MNLGAARIVHPSLSPTRGGAPGIARLARGPADSAFEMIS